MRTLLIGLILALSPVFLTKYWDHLEFRGETETFDIAVTTISNCLLNKDKCQKVDNVIEMSKLTLEEYDIYYPKTYEKGKHKCYHGCWLCYLIQIRDLAKWARLDSAKRLGKCVAANENVEILRKSRITEPMRPVIKSLLPTVNSL